MLEWKNGPAQIGSTDEFQAIVSSLRDVYESHKVKSSQNQNLLDEKKRSVTSLSSDCSVVKIELGKTSHILSLSSKSTIDYRLFHERISAKGERASAICLDNSNRMKQLEDMLLEIKNDFRDRESNKNKIALAVEDLKRNIKTKKIMLDQTISEKDNIERLLEKTISSKKSLQNQLTNDRSKTTEADSQLTTQKTQADEASKNCESLREQIKERKEHRRKLDKQMNDDKEETVGLLEHIGIAQEDLSQAQCSMASEVAELQERLCVLQLTNSSLFKDVKQLKKASIESNERKDLLKNQTNDAASEMEKLEISKKANEKRVLEQGHIMSNIDQEIVEEEKSIEDSKSNMGETKTDRVKKEQHISTLKAQIEEEKENYVKNDKEAKEIRKMNQEIKKSSNQKSKETIKDLEAHKQEIQDICDDEKNNQEETEKLLKSFVSKQKAAQNKRDKERKIVSAKSAEKEKVFETKKAQDSKLQATKQKLMEKMKLNEDATREAECEEKFTTAAEYDLDEAKESVRKHVDNLKGQHNAKIMELKRKYNFFIGVDAGLVSERFVQKQQLENLGFEKMFYQEMSKRREDQTTEIEVMLNKLEDLQRKFSAAISSKNEDAQVPSVSEDDSVEQNALESSPKVKPKRRKRSKLKELSVNTSLVNESTSEFVAPKKPTRRHNKKRRSRSRSQTPKKSSPIIIYFGRC
eukprot:255940_1